MTSPSRADFDLFDLPSDYFDDPYPYFHALRRHDPVHRNADGSILLTRYRDVEAVWRDNRGVVDKAEIFQRRFGEGGLLEHHTSTMLFRDEPDHSRLRRCVEPLLTPKAVKRQEATVEALVDSLIDEALERGRLDFVEDFALRLPMTMICSLLGVPVEDGPFLHEIGARILFPLNPKVSEAAIADGNAAVDTFRSYLQPHFAAARTRLSGEPPETIIDACVAAEADLQLSTDEMAHMCIILLNGGHETTANLLAGSVHALIDRPEALRHVAEAADMKPVVEEMIRFVTPLQLQGRRTTEAIRLPEGQELPEGTEIILCQASANRDETVFVSPDQIDFDRPFSKHVSFGLGSHLCIGRFLARLEATIALPRILTRCGRIERTGPAVYRPNARFRGLDTLPIAVTAA